MVEAAGRNGWRKTTAAAIFQGELESRSLLPVIQQMDRFTRWQ